MVKKKPSRFKLIKKIRKPLPRPAVIHKSKKAYNRKKVKEIVEEYLEEIREEGYIKKDGMDQKGVINPVEVIKKKRDGMPLKREELYFMIRGMLSGEIPYYQITALLMAIYFQGMADDELLALTQEIIASGMTLDLSSIPGRKVDKHSTGGVGDKVSLILAPLVASAGVYVPMVSGRALGHTGGTLDKLESIPGFETELSLQRVKRQLMDIGVIMIGQTEEIAPADRRLYALRDVTATVESIPLIASSIMGKKLSEGIDGLVLDVKVGTGAFMKDIEKAEELARRMVNIGKGLGKEVVAILTDMNQPLGRSVGNSLEIIEAIDLLKGDMGGKEDLWEVTKELGAWMLKIGKKVVDLQDGRFTMDLLLREGKGLEKLKEIIQVQSGNSEVVDNYSLLPVAAEKTDVESVKKGFISTMDTEQIGWASILLGCGRRHVEDKIDHGVGIIVHKKTGDRVEKDETLFSIYHNPGQDIERIKNYLLNSISYSIGPVKKEQIIKGILS